MNAAAPKDAPLRVNNRKHEKKHGTAPPCPERGPEAGSTHICDFHGSGVNALSSCPFLQSRFFRIIGINPVELFQFVDIGEGPQ